MEISIQTLQTADWESVREIYCEGLATGQATFETEAPSADQWDDGHLLCARLGAFLDGRLVGWAALSAVSKRRAYAGVAEVSVYVAENERGHGVGRTLLQRLIIESEQNGIWTLQASIFPENEASLKLHEALGFRRVGYRERISKLNGLWRDTVILERRSTEVGID
ncbi:MAG TPA: GNAT family N-acetyltransferase [Pyrinomonadaceae bacterium]|nr:GNAT family N-acetyltransferase [Pyrinomonadaceae bacterium]